MVAGTSTLLLDEFFSEGDDRFFEELVATRADRKLHALAPRWFVDERPWARGMLLRYIDDGCDREAHRGLVKGLFKLAEEAGDDLLMAHFLVAFDRLVGHVVKQKSGWNWDTGQRFETYHRVRTTQQPRLLPRKPKIRGGQFSIYTRQYLQRRALRYFRRLGFRDAARYGSAVRTALLLYEDRHLERPEQLLDAWGLMHLLYHGSPVIVRAPRGIRVAEGRKLSELEPAPLHPGAWRGSFEETMAMLAVTPCLFVRRWLVSWLEHTYEEPLRAPDIRHLKRLLWSPHADVQSFAAGLLERARGAETLPLVEWLSLLDIDHPTAISVLCDMVKRHVSPDRLDLAACVDLACARPAPVAELGLTWARTKPIDGPEALQTALRLVEARAANVIENAVAWLVGLVGQASLGTSHHVLTLLDAPQVLARTAGVRLMKDPRFSDDPQLWAALVESPYADTRAFLITHLESRIPSLPEEGVQRTWATTLLAVSRASRAKRQVLRQLARRVATDPDRAEDWLPLMAIALRSVREPERRAALAAIGKAAFLQPCLRQPIAKHIPELQLFPEVPS